MARVCVAFGANLGDAQATVLQAIQDVGALASTQLQKASSLYASAPLEATGPEFVNAVAIYSTNLPPLDLLDALQNEDRVSGDERSDTQQVQRAIDQLEANQVQAVQAQAQREVMFSMTLPFVDGNPVELTFRRPPRGDGSPPVITVNVHSKSESLGPVWLQTKLTGTDKVELTMWAEMADVAQQARARQDALAGELTQAGLNLQAFKVVHGARPAQDADWTPSGRGLVVDISA